MCHYYYKNIAQKIPTLFNYNIVMYWLVNKCQNKKDIRNTIFLKYFQSPLDCFSFSDLTYLKITTIFSHNIYHERQKLNIKPCTKYKILTINKPENSNRYSKNILMIIHNHTYFNIMGHLLIFKV